MAIEALVKNYEVLCYTHRVANVKAIVPVEYRLNTSQHNVMGGVVKIKVITHTGKTIIIEHVDESSYAENLQVLKAL